MKFISILLSIAILFSAVSLTAAGAQMPEYCSISGGTLHSAAIQSDGSLWTWGYNFSGELATGDVVGTSSPKKVIDTGVVSVSLGNGHSAAIKSDGSLWTWGDNMFGQLGIRNATESLKPVKVMDDVKSVAAAEYFTAALKHDDSLWIWGDISTTTDTLTPVKVMENVAAVSAGGLSAAALKHDGSLWMWGDNSFGQLGIGTITREEAPVKVMDHVDFVSVGATHTAVIKNDGSLWVWGRNVYGQLGNGTTQDSSTPIKIMEDVASASMGKDHSAAIKTDGSLWMWGYNWNGEVGNGEQKNVGKPTKIMDNVVTVELGYNHALAITEDGSLWTWGANRGGQVGVGHNEYAVRVPTKIMDNVMLPTSESTDVESEPTDSAVDAPFAAVSNWAAAEIESALAHNLVPETLMGLDLTQKVNRSEFAAVAIQLYETLSGQVAAEAKHCEFSDIAGDKNAAAIRKAYEIEITTGTSKTKFDPQSTLNREQLATMLCRVIKKSIDPTWTMATDASYDLDVSGVQKFQDDADISEWAKPSVYFMSKLGIIKGVSDTRFAPKNISTEQELSGYASATREQAIIIALRILMNANELDLK